MSKSAGKCNKIYVYHTKDISEITCIIYGHRNSSDECKVLGEFGSEYPKGGPTK